MSQRLSDAARWSVCFALALSLHVGGAVALLARWSDDADLVANAPVIMLELAPVPVAPQTQPTELPPDIVESRQAEPEPAPEKPLEKVELPPEPQAELQPAPPPKPVEKPKEKKPTQKRASLTSAPSTAEHKAARAAAPAAGASSHNPHALPNWKSALVAQIERHKRYPDGTRDHGVALVAFSVDRGGGVHHPRIVRSSGSSLLDRDAIAWVQRSQPLPPPPPDVAGTRIAITVPLRYNTR